MRNSREKQFLLFLYILFSSTYKLKQSQRTWDYSRFEDARSNFNEHNVSPFILRVFVYFI